MMMDCVHVFDGPNAHTGRIFSVACCSLSDGRRIAASASHDRSVKIWCVDTFDLIRTIEYTDFVWRVFLVHSNFHSTTPKTLVVAFVSTEEKIQVSDLLTGETLNVFYGRLIYSGILPNFSDPVIITAVGEEDLSFVDVNNGLPLKTIYGGFEKVFRAVVSHGSDPSQPHPTLIFTTWNSQNRRSTIQTYDITDIEKESMIDVPRDKSRTSVVFEGDSRDGVTSLVITRGKKPMICSGHYDFIVRLWDVETKLLVMVLEGSYSCSFSRNSELVVGHSDYVGSVAVWRGIQQIVVSGSSDGTIKVWDIRNGELLATGEGHTRDTWAVAVTYGPKPLIISGNFDRTLRVWDLNPIIAGRNWERRKNYCYFIHNFFSPKRKVR
jgi:WD40 repeat protein